MRKSTNKTILSSTTVLILSILVGLIVWIPNFIIDYNSWVSKLLGLFITIISALYLFFKNREIRFLKNETLFPFLFILLFIGLTTNDIGLNVGYIALICTSSAFFRLIYQSNKFMAPWHTMESMMILSTGSLFMPILWIYIPVFWFGMTVFNKLNSKCLLAAFMGLITPYLIALGIIYVGDFQEYIDKFILLIKESYSINLPNGFFQWSSISLIFLTALIGSSSLFNPSDDRLYILWINNFGAILLFTTIILNILFYNSELSICSAYWTTFLLTYYYSNNNNQFSKIYFWLLLSISLILISLKFFF